MLLNYAEPRLQLHADHGGPLLVRGDLFHAAMKVEAQRDGGIRSDLGQHPDTFELLRIGADQGRRHAECSGRGVDRAQSIIFKGAATSVEPATGRTVNTR